MIPVSISWNKVDWRVMKKELKNITSGDGGWMEITKMVGRMPRNR